VILPEIGALSQAGNCRFSQRRSYAGVPHRSLSRALSPKGKPCLPSNTSLSWCPSWRLPWRVFAGASAESRSSDRRRRPAATPCRRALAQLQGDATGARNTQKAVILATHVARYQSAPANLGRSFPLDRRALAQFCDLPLSEGEIRGALKLLEEVGFVVRVPAPGSPYQRTVEGLRRKPIWFTLGEPYLAMFAEANRKPRGGPQAARGERRPLPAPFRARHAPAAFLEPARSER